MRPIGFFAPRLTTTHTVLPSQNADVITHQVNSTFQKDSPRSIGFTTQAKSKIKREPLDPETLSKVCAIQMEVIPGRPDLNYEKMLRFIDQAKTQGFELAVFPEQCVLGYMIGDMWERAAVIRDVMKKDERLREASDGIALAWGSVVGDETKVNRDGRMRKYNVMRVAQNQKWVSNGAFEGFMPKTNLPNYRFFEDPRHHTPTSYIARERGLNTEDLIRPFQLKLNGKMWLVGFENCEDRWDADYIDKVTQILLDNDAQLICNGSASNFSWRKNEKRHRVIRAGFEENGVPFIYANIVGSQNNGKNVLVYDGNSTIYNSRGEPMKSAPDYEEAILSLSVAEWNSPAPAREKEILSAERDMEEIDMAVRYGIKKMMSHMPTPKIAIAMSGGVDSTVEAMIMEEVLGQDAVYGFNIPTEFNSQTTQKLAREAAAALGIHYAVIPMQGLLDFTVDLLKNVEFERLNGSGGKTKLDINDDALDNIQARHRGATITAGVAAGLGNAVYPANSNKDETATGFATLLGDVPGFMAPLADLWKGQVYAYGHFLNKRRVAQGKKPIPEAILNPKILPPSAELRAAHNVDQGKGDPFFYPYHDALMRSLVEYRNDPEDILRWYAEGTLDEHIQLTPGTVKSYFPTHKDFILDLRRIWNLMHRNYFKRIQGPPIMTVSKRAFGYDLREAQIDPYYTEEFLRLEAELLK
jgi:NAD+ synthase (glutamine-hydrolysing)